VAAVLEASVGLLHGRPLGRALDVRATRLPA